MIKIVCSHCEQRISAPDEVIGTVVECPTCQQAFEALETASQARQGPVVARPIAKPPPLPVAPKASESSGSGYWWAVFAIGLVFAGLNYHRTASRRLENDRRMYDKTAGAWTEMRTAPVPEVHVSADGTSKLLDDKTASSFADLSAQINQVTTNRPADFWAMRSVAGLRLEAPFAYKASKDLTPTLSANARTRIEYSHLFDCDTPDMNFRAPVYRAQFVEGVEPNIDTYIRGSMSVLIALTGARPEDITYTTLEVSGHEARRGSFRTITAGGTYHAEFLVIRNGQSFWEVRVLFPRDADVNRAKRILKSVQIAEE